MSQRIASTPQPQVAAPVKSHAGNINARSGVGAAPHGCRPNVRRPVSEVGSGSNSKPRSNPLKKGPESSPFFAGNWWIGSMDAGLDVRCKIAPAGNQQALSQRPEPEGQPMCAGHM